MNRLDERLGPCLPCRYWCLNVVKSQTNGYHVLLVYMHPSKHARTDTRNMLICMHASNRMYEYMFVYVYTNIHTNIHKHLRRFKFAHT